MADAHESEMVALVGDALVADMTAKIKLLSKPLRIGVYRAVVDQLSATLKEESTVTRGVASVSNPARPATES